MGLKSKEYYWQIYTQFVTKIGKNPFMFGLSTHSDSFIEFVPFALSIAHYLIKVLHGQWETQNLD